MTKPFPPNIQSHTCLSTHYNLFKKKYVNIRILYCLIVANTFSALEKLDYFCNYHVSLISFVMEQCSVQVILLICGGTLQYIYCSMSTDFYHNGDFIQQHLGCRVHRTHCPLYTIYKCLSCSYISFYGDETNVYMPFPR